MTVTYKGLDCVADIGTDQYAAYHEESQTGKNAWAYQANYAKWCLYFGAVLLFLIVLKKGLYMLSDWSYRNTKIGKKELRWRPLEYITALGRKISYCRIPLVVSRVTGLPASLGTLLILGACTLFICLICFIPHPYFRGCRGFGSPQLAVRAGIMCMALLPFLIIMSGKTNFISFITGISYEKLNIFHQALAWGTLFLGLVHTLPFYIQSNKEGGYERVKYMFYDNGSILFLNGTPPLVFLFLLCVLSTRFSRAIMYEIWWHSHWILGLAYVATLWWHVYDMLDTDHYIWGTLGFWVFQMLYRAVVKTTFKPNQHAFKSKEATLKTSADCFEVVVPIKNRDELTWAPGQHVFIRFVYGLHTIDNHPFSVLSTSKSRGASDLKLIVKPCRGLTKKINDLIQDEKSEKKLRCFVDGPYGGMNRDVLSFDKLVLVATGTGVSVTAPFLSHIAESLHVVTNCVQKVEFYWVVPTVDHIAWIHSELQTALKAAAAEDLTSMFDIKIFITGSRDNGAQVEMITSKSQISAGTPDNSSKDLETKESGDNSPDVDDLIKIFYNAKPDFSKLLQSVKLEKRTAFICSGTRSVQEACGNAASRAQSQVWSSDSDIQEVYLHTENFGW